MSSVTDQDPKALANYRFVKGAVIILGVLIVIAVIALILGFALRAQHRAETASSGAVANAISLPAGAKIVGVNVDQGRLILRVRTGAAEEIDIIDTGNGKLVGQVKATAAANPQSP